MKQPYPRHEAANSDDRGDFHEAKKELPTVKQIQLLPFPPLSEPMCLVAAHRPYGQRHESGDDDKAPQPVGLPRLAHLYPSTGISVPLAAYASVIHSATMSKNTLPSSTE